MLFSWVASHILFLASFKFDTYCYDMDVRRCLL